MSKSNYILTVQNFQNNFVEYYEFQNIREALETFEEKCAAVGYDYSHDQEGNFIAGGVNKDWRIELITNNY